MLNEIQGSRFQEGQTKRTLQFLARTVEQKLNATTSYAYNVDKTALSSSWKKTGKLYGEMENCRLGQFEVQRQEPLQQLSDLSVLLANM